VLRIERPIVGTFDDVASAYVWLQQQAFLVPEKPENQ
jgi:hypothetical protein